VTHFLEQIEAGERQQPEPVRAAASIW